MIRQLVTPSAVFFVAVSALGPFWFGPATYALLRTYKFAPSGLVVWMLIFAQIVFALWTVGRSLVRAREFGKKIGPLRLALESGDETVRDELFELRKQAAHATRFPLFAFTGFFFLLPAYFAIVLGSAHSGGQSLIKEHGKLRYSTQREDIDKLLRTFEDHQFMVPWKR